MAFLVPAVMVSQKAHPLESRGDALIIVIEKARKGDTAAFAEIYRSCVARVYAVCLRLSQDSSRAESLTQDVFVRAWEKLDQFREDSLFSTWIHRLAINVVLQDLRSEGRRRCREQAGASQAGDDEHEASKGRIEARLDLDRALLQLPERYRIVFVLHEIEGLHHEEIAKMLSIAVGTSKSHLYQARSLLKEVLR